jgi:polysaccharide deacetylase family protein (PEP-CTERM system associated)
MINAMTVDHEDWFHSIAGIPQAAWEHQECRLDDATLRLLDLFDRFGVRATFFILGAAADQRPELVKRIHAAGHEIATHGYAHRLVYSQSPAEFRADLRRSIALLEDLTGESILGYRAPYWTITRESYWALEVLLEEGIRYDSSIYPVKTYLYGIPDAPRFAHEVKGAQGRHLLEVPPSTIEVLGKRIPMAGGFYLRTLPTWFVVRGIARINREGHPAVVYLHPPELDRNKPVVRLPLMERILHYHNLGVIEDRIVALLSRFKFAPIRELFAI